MLVELHNCAVELQMHVTTIFKYQPTFPSENVTVIRKFSLFANSVKRHICDVKKSPLWHDLSLSVNDRMISPFREYFIFQETSHMRSFAKIKPLRKFPNQQYTVESRKLEVLGTRDLISMYRKFELYGVRHMNI